MLNDYGLSVKISVADCDIDWYQNWKKYYKPLEAGRYIIIPEWQKGQVRSEKIKIYINPGMAFGTGEHQSTRLCLKLMSELDFTGKKGAGHRMRQRHIGDSRHKIKRPKLSYVRH